MQSLKFIQFVFIYSCLVVADYYNRESATKICTLIRATLASSKNRLHSFHKASKLSSIGLAKNLSLIHISYMFIKMPSSNMFPFIRKPSYNNIKIQVIYGDVYKRQMHDSFIKNHWVCIVGSLSPSYDTLPENMQKELQGLVNTCLLYTSQRADHPCGRYWLPLRHRIRIQSTYGYPCTAPIWCQRNIRQDRSCLLYTSPNHPSFIACG